jgi:hypothetical protein
VAAVLLRRRGTIRTAAALEDFSERRSGNSPRVTTGSVDPEVSIGSASSFCSIGSIGSAFSIGSIGSAFSIGSIGSFCSIGSIGSACSVGSFASFVSAFGSRSAFSFGRFESGKIESRRSGTGTERDH